MGPEQTKLVDIALKINILTNYRSREQSRGRVENKMPSNQATKEKESCFLDTFELDTPPLKNGLRNWNCQLA